MVQLGQRIFLRLLEHHLIAIYVYSHEEGLTETELVRLSFAGHVVSHFQVRGGTYQGQASRIDHSLPVTQDQKRSTDLLVIHAQRTIEVRVVSFAEEHVRRIWPKHLYSLIGQFLHGWQYNFPFLLAHLSVDARIKREHCQSGVGNAEV